MLPVAMYRSFSEVILSYYGISGLMVSDNIRLLAWQTYKFDSADSASTECNVRQLQCLVEFIAIRHWDKVWYLWLTCFCCCVDTFFWLVGGTEFLIPSSNDILLFKMMFVYIVHRAVWIPIRIEDVQVSGIWVTLYVCMWFLFIELQLAESQ